MSRDKRVERAVARNFIPCYNRKKCGGDSLFCGSYNGWGNLMMWQYPMKVYRFYSDGFRNMTVGKTLWKIIAIKVFVMFAILKLFFFPNYLKTNFSTDQQRADHVLHELTGMAEKNY